MKRNTMLLFLAARCYEYLDEDFPNPEDSDQHDRGPSLSASPPATPTSPPAVAAPPGRAEPASPPGRPSRSGWDMSQMMWLAGGSGRPGDNDLLSLLNTSKFVYIYIYI